MIFFASAGDHGLAGAVLLTDELNFFFKGGVVVLSFEHHGAVIAEVILGGDGLGGGKAAISVQRCAPDSEDCAAKRRAFLPVPT